MKNAESKPTAKAEIIILGVKYLRDHVYACLMIIFAITQFYVYESQKNEARQITRPTSAAARQPGLPVFVTGALEFQKPKSAFIKSEKYLRVEQVAEVFGFSEWPGPKGKIHRGLTWTDDPKDPKTWGHGEFATDKMYTRRYESRVWGDENASVKDGGITYTFDARMVEPNFSIDNKAPNADETSEGTLRYFGTNSEESTEWLHLYESKECATGRIPGCQRVRLRALAIPAGHATLIGDLDGRRLIPFRERLIIGPGDLNTVIGATYAGTANATFAEFGYFLLLCIALYLARDLTLYIPLFASLSTFRRTLLLAVLLTALFVYAATFWYLWLAGAVAACFVLNNLRLAAAKN